mmetsp:Transcript_23546/g.75082  ORF Transcript_23546/g.75082 Transcript_23546/m.75082 type:complete len:261 (-) Transcript_23546:206-988(-)
MSSCLRSKSSSFTRGVPWRRGSPLASSVAAQRTTLTRWRAWTPFQPPRATWSSRASSWAAAECRESRAGAGQRSARAAFSSTMTSLATFRPLAAGGGPGKRVGGTALWSRPSCLPCRRRSRCCGRRTGRRRLLSAAKRVHAALRSKGHPSARRASSSAAHSNGTTARAASTRCDRAAVSRATWIGQSGWTLRARWTRRGPWTPPAPQSPARRPCSTRLMALIGMFRLFAEPVLRGRCAQRRLYFVIAVRALPVPTVDPLS